MKTIESYVDEICKWRSDSGLREAVIAAMTDAVSAARAEAFEQAAKAMCAECDSDFAVEQVGPEEWQHFTRGRYRVTCRASAIRDLITSPPPPDARDAALALALPIIDAYIKEMRERYGVDDSELPLAARSTIAALLPDTSSEKGEQ